MQSGVEGLGSEGAITTSTTIENMVDVVGSDPVATTEYVDNWINVGQDDLLSIKDFFARPVEIANGSIGNSTNFLNAYGVWDLWSLVPSVRAKLRNYAYFRGNLHIRVAISGTPFHYGKLLLSYQPCALNNTTLSAVLGGYPHDGINAYLSQATETAVMNSNDNQPVDLVLPFIHPNPVCRLFNNATTAISSGTSFYDFQQLGTLYFTTLTQLNNTQSTSDDLSFHIYAWVEDIMLGVPTGTQLAISTESGVDERKTGPVEKFSSAMVSISDTLVPYIGPWAVASRLGFSALKGIAALFGWSTPTILDTPHFVKNRPFIPGATTIGSETVDKITLDPQQELTVDPSVTADDDDHMVISTIARRPGFIGNLTWTPGESFGYPFGLFRISPFMGYTTTASSLVYVIPTPMAFAAAPFNHWRGDIVLRFEIASSKFHRGKLAIYYEPNYPQYTLIAANLNLNKQYYRVIDIQETQSFEICIEWATYRAWLSNAGVGSYQYNTQGMNGQSVGYVSNGSVGINNGYVAILPFTNLQSPDNNPIYISVFAYAKDLQVNVLSAANMPVILNVPAQSGYDYSAESSKEVSCIELNPTSATRDNICKAHFGEQPLSFRALLKRYTTTHFLGSDSFSGTNNVAYNTSLYPLTTGVPGTGLDNYYSSLFSYLRWAYVGVRGGYRHRPWLIESATAPNLARIKCTLTAGYNTALTATSYTPSCAFSTLEGTSASIPHTNSGVEVEMPFYNQNLFWFAFLNGYINTTNDYMANFSLNSMQVEFESVSNVTQIAEDTASAEDFTFLHFNGAPPFSATAVGP